AIDAGSEHTVRAGVRNCHRTVGARTASAITQRWGAEGMADGSIHLELSGVAGQSFAAFTVAGMDVRLVGVANDAVGKGMAGGRIVIALPPAQASLNVRNAIIGNAALYGATGGAAYIA